MAKTIYQESAMEYAKAYLERLLDLEDFVGQQVEEKLRSMVQDEIKKYDCIIVDEVQFATPEQVDYLSDIVDFMDVPVVAYGLRADFKNELFPGSKRLIAIADVIHEVKTVCWCGRKATCNTRYNENGVVRSGPQVMLGANDSYVALCRKHFKLGQLKDDI